MSIVLSHKSALIALLRNRSLAGECRHCFPTEAKASREEIEYLRRAFNLGGSSPDVLVTQRKQRFHFPDTVQIHYAKNLADIPSFVQLDGAYLASPELLFVQYAAKMPLIEAILFGYYLCGDYRPAEVRAKTGNQPLTSSDKLQSFIESLPQMAGKQQAAQAARFVVDNSFSPQESRLTIIIILPRRLGGYALLKPQLNQAIPGTARTGDLCWLDKGLILEYDSSENHGSAPQRANDAARRTEIELEDYRVISVTPQQTHSLKRLDELAKLAGNILGQYKHPETTQQRDARVALHEELFFRVDLPF